MIEIEDVKAWWVGYSDIGHICLQTKQGWSTTACGIWGSGTPVLDRPKRICRKCRSKLPELSKADKSVVLK